ncbi:MAG: hypothetical protein WCK43_02555 [bacterium]
MAKLPQVFVVKFLIIAFACVLSASASAKSFRSKFISMELPPNWDCQQEELDWVCQPDNPNLRNEAIVVIVTKAVNPPDDTFDKYKEYLKQTKAMRDLLGKGYTTQVKYVKDKKIRDQMWVDSLQIGPEIPGFISRYVASIKEQVAGLISYHVAESVFAKWAEVLDKMIDSAEIRFDPKAFDEIVKTRNMSLFVSPKQASFTAPKNQSGGVAEAPKKDDGDLAIKIGGGVLILAAIGFIIYRKKKGLG